MKKILLFISVIMLFSCKKEIAIEQCYECYIQKYSFGALICVDTSTVCGTKDSINYINNNTYYTHTDEYGIDRFSKVVCK